MIRLSNLQKEYVTLINRRKEALIRLRKKHKIVLEGTNLESVPDLTPSWKSMAEKHGFSDAFLKGVREGGYARPTPVQMQAVPVIMERRDAIVLAETGSGKSLAFFAPLVEKIKRGEGLSCLVMAPTRELTI